MQFEHLKYPFKVGIEGQLLTGCTYWELRSPVDPEICDQLWILDRVHQKYLNKFFYRYFACVVTLSYLIGKLGQSGII